MASNDYDYSSDLSSPLSTPGPSPSPPPEFLKVAYPSPPASQESSHSGSPCPDGMDSSTAASDRDGPPPAKRRRISEKKPRTTEHLDLRAGTIKSDQEPQLERLIHTLRNKRKIVVVAGAGISVSAGIPDFRSSTGLFSSLRQEYNLKGSGKHLFDASVYKDDSSTSSFHHMVRNMSKLTKNAKPTKFHHMLATLAQDDRLLRLYTQNVDGIDTGLDPLATSIPLRKNDEGKWPKTVQLHGGLDKMVCSKCADLRDFDADLFDGPAPPACNTCIELDRVRTDVAGKRSHGIGRMRPRMVLYNEHNPDDEAIGKVTQDDLRKRPDAIVVVGTSMKIPGVKRIVREMCATVRARRDGVAIWINNDPEPVAKEFEDCWDIVVRGTCDEVARHVGLRHWFEMDDSREPTEEEWKKAVEQDVEVVINKTFKPLSGTTKFRRALPSPEYSPIAVRVSMEEDSTQEEIIVSTPPTPSKSARNSPEKKAQSAFDAIKNTTTTKAGNKRVFKATSKPATTKSRAASTAKKTGPAKKAGTTNNPQAKITSTLKQTKAVSATGKAVKGFNMPKKPVSTKAENAAMKPVAPADSRNNAGISPRKSVGISFPGLKNFTSPKKDTRMNVSSIMN